MTDLAGYPSAELQFDSGAHVIGGTDGVSRLAGDQTRTDLLVLSHGWNNDRDEAIRLYQGLASSLRAVLDSGAAPLPADRRIGIVAVVWPSKRFNESGLVAGESAPFDAEVVQEQIQGLRAVFDDAESRQTLDSAVALVPQLPTAAGAREVFADQLRSLLASTAFDAEDVPADLFAIPGDELMERLSRPAPLPPPEGAAFGTDTAVDPLPFGTWGAAQRLINLTTFYTMKNRAGEIGEGGLAPVLADIKRTRPGLRIHLVGHSFGSRLSTAATKALPADTVTTLTLLQAAFSHHGFAEHWTPGQNGHFRNVIGDKLVTGPVLITHTGNDKAVGIAYALASRLSGDAASLLGDANDIYGGMGRNGARKTPEALAGTLHPVGVGYVWQPRLPHNLLADDFIKGHADVTGHEVAHAIASALAT